MRKSIFMLLLVAQQAMAQVSVYDCGVIHPLINQIDIDNSSYNFHRQCVVFDANQNYISNQNNQKKITANTAIHLEPRNHTSIQLGNYNSSGGFWMKLEEKSLYDVVLLNDNLWDLNAVGKFKKLELGIEITGELLDRINDFLGPNPTSNGINPFLEGDLDVKAEFIHSESSTIKHRDGFYFQDFESDPNLTDWVEKPTPYPIRIRFAPPETGLWYTYISITYDNATINLPMFTFNVVETGDPGYVGVHNNNKNFERSGKLIFPVGHNMAGPYSPGFMNQFPQNPNETNKSTTKEQWNSMQDDIQNYIDQGGKYIKLLQQPYTSLIEFEHQGNYYNRMHYAWEQDKIIEVCETNDVLILFNLFFQVPLMKYGQGGSWVFDYGNEYPDDLSPAEIPYVQSFAPYCYFDSLTDEPYEMFLDENDLFYHEQRNRYYMARYGYSPQIYAYELLSEPWWLNHTYDEDLSDQILGDLPFYNETHPLHHDVRDALYNYHTRMAQYIKEDLGMSDQLIGIQVYGQGWNENPSKFDGSAYSPFIDFIAVNHYGAGAEKYLITKNTPNNEADNEENSIYRSIVRPIHFIIDKPLIFSEAGHEGFNTCSNFMGHYLDVMVYGFTGLAGFYMWDGYWHDANGFDQRNLWESTIRAQQHMDGIGVTNVLSNNSGNWVNGRQMAERINSDDKESKELHYYVSENQQLISGVVWNRTFNYHNWRTEIGCLIPAYDSVTNQGVNANISNVSPLNNPTNINWYLGGNELYVDGLIPHFRYEVDWFDFRTGEYIYTDCRKAKNNGRLTLRFPELIVQKYGTRLALDDVDLNAAVWFVGRGLGGSCPKTWAEDGEETDNTDMEVISTIGSMPMVYPTLTEDKININTLESTKMMIVDAFGKELKGANLSAGLNTLDISSFGSGIYFIHLNNHHEVFKVFKK